MERRSEITLVVAVRASMGLDLAREHEPSLIFMDLNLPDMPGEELLRRLRVDRATKPFDLASVFAVLDASVLEAGQVSGVAGVRPRLVGVTHWRESRSRR